MKLLEAGPMPCPHHRYDLICKREDPHYRDILGIISSYMAFLNSNPEYLKHHGVTEKAITVEQLALFMKNRLTILLPDMLYGNCRLRCKKPAPIKVYVINMNTGEAEYGEIDTSLR